jgi:hypothetical protein
MKLIQKILFILYIFTLTSITSTSHGMMGFQIFNGPPTAPQCRNCHYNLKRFPTLGLNLGLRNPDRHHLLIGTTIPPRSRSKAPDAIGATNAGGKYNCFSCHLMLPEQAAPLEGNFAIVEPFRDCLQCHPAWRVTGGPMGGMMGGGRNVHMENGALFRQRNCQACHGAGQGIDTDGDGLSDWPDEPTSGGRGGMGGGRGGMGGGRGGMGGRR